MHAFAVDRLTPAGPTEPRAPATLARRMRWLLAVTAVTAVTALTALTSGRAHAGDFSVGLGLGADRGHVDCIAAYPCDRGSTQAKLFAAYQLDPSFELQALYFDAGRFKGGDTTERGTHFGGRFRVSGVALSAGYRWNMAPDWSVAGRVGVANVRTAFDYADPFSGSTSRSVIQPIVGVGIGYAVSPVWRIGLDVDATRFKVHQTRGSLRMLGLTAQYSF